MIQLSSLELDKDKILVSISQDGPNSDWKLSRCNVVTAYQHHNARTWA